MTAKEAVRPKFGPGYMKPMRAFFLRMNDDDAARAEFLADADQAVVKYGIIDKLPGVRAQGHADDATNRTLVLPPLPFPPPPGSENLGIAKRASLGARESTNVAFFVRANMVLWFALTEALWGGYDEEQLSPSDKIMLRACREKPFKDELIKNPRDVLNAYGFRIPPHMNVRVVEQTDDTVHVILPPKGDLAALSYEALEELVSGWVWHRALGEPGLGDL